MSSDLLAALLGGAAALVGYFLGRSYFRLRAARARLAAHHRSAGLVPRPASPPGDVRASVLPATAGPASASPSAHSGDRATILCPVCGGREWYYDRSAGGVAWYACASCGQPDARSRHAAPPPPQWEG